MPSMEISSTSRSASTRSSSATSSVDAVPVPVRGTTVSGAAAVMPKILAHGARSVHSAGVQMPSGAHRGAGRPPATTREDIERVAFSLFADHGFDETTVDDIATAAGIGRRTFFRYFASKNDVVWGAFDAGLDHFRAVLDAVDPDQPWRD